MNDHPILFSPEMVRAIIDGRKTQTRRVIVPQPEYCGDGRWNVESRPRSGYSSEKTMRDILPIYCPYGAIGHFLWVRENGWERPERSAKMLREGADTWPHFLYDADDCDHEQLRDWGWKRTPSIHMPRWASRITLEITAIRVERLQDMSDLDMLKEGVEGPDADGYHPYLDRIDYWRHLWDTVNAKRGHSWNSNPWVWVIEFEVVRNGR